MSDPANTLEAIKLIDGWAKWLITIATAVIAIIGGALASGRPASKMVTLLGVCAVASFVLSILSAAALLATLPEITQQMVPGQNVWRTRDSVAGRLLHLDTQGFAILESSFFGIGILLFAFMIAVAAFTRLGACAESDERGSGKGDA